ncbi:MAG: SDR family oxidoreductase, partial [Anaerolineae bacterium]|nr:SDR family oxidoreductase [Anaerolineae bacterium]
LAQDGAHVVLADTNDAEGEKVADDLQRKYGKGRALSVPTDVTREEALQQALRQTVLMYGGLDVLVTDSIPTARAAFTVMEAQGIGGAMVLIRAAELDSAHDLVAAGGALGIRVNSMLPGVQAEAEDVAEAITFLAGPRSRKITGTILPVGGV